MPPRDDIDAKRAGPRRGCTRRAALAGLGAAVAVPRLRTASMADAGPLRVGVVQGLGFDIEGLSRATRARARRTAVPVAFAAWGSLADHATATGAGVIDAAVLPARPGEDRLPVPSGLRALLLRGAAQPRRIGIALRHPGSEAALRSMLPDGAALTLVTMPPAMLVGNLRAGVIDAALLLGAGLRADEQAIAGLTAVPLDCGRAAALLPPLTIRMRPGLPDRQDLSS